MKARIRIRKKSFRIRNTGLMCVLVPGTHACRQEWRRVGPGTSGGCSPPPSALSLTAAAGWPVVIRTRINQNKLSIYVLL
jgi:hypothetical protein